MFLPTDPAEAPFKSQHQKLCVWEEAFEITQPQLLSDCNYMKDFQVETDWAQSTLKSHEG